MVDDTSGNNNYQNLKLIIEKSDQFIKEFQSIKNNIFQDNGLPILFLKSNLRKKYLEIRNKQCLNGEESLQMQNLMEE